MIPQRLQNLCIRDYAQAKKLLFSFAVSEYFDARPALMLFSQFEHADKIGGFVFYSLLLLPSDTERRREFYDRAAKAGTAVHFALEDMALLPGDDPVFIERVYQISLDRRLEETRHALLGLRQGGAR